ncbi:hypothetical protein LX88_006235 [Lentzea californiensis]|nr:hypothetical protein [Lentzea californiensis]
MPRSVGVAQQSDQLLGRRPATPASGATSASLRPSSTGPAGPCTATPPATPSTTISCQAGLRGGLTQHRGDQPYERGGTGVEQQVHAFLREHTYQLREVHLGPGPRCPANPRAWRCVGPCAGAVRGRRRPDHARHVVRRRHHDRRVLAVHREPEHRLAHDVEQLGSAVTRDDPSKSLRVEERGAVGDMIPRLNAPDVLQRVDDLQTRALAVAYAHSRARGHGAARPGSSWWWRDRRARDPPGPGRHTRRTARAATGRPHRHHLALDPRRPAHPPRIWLSPDAGGPHAHRAGSCSNPAGCQNRDCKTSGLCREALLIRVEVGDLRR